MDVQVFAWLERLHVGRECMHPFVYLQLWDVLDRAARLVGPSFEDAVRRYECTPHAGLNPEDVGSDMYPLPEGA